MLITFSPVPGALFICMLHTKDSQFNVPITPPFVFATPRTFVQLSILHVCLDHDRDCDFSFKHDTRPWREPSRRKQPTSLTLFHRRLNPSRHFVHSTHQLVALPGGDISFNAGPTYDCQTPTILFGTVASNYQSNAHLVCTPSST